MDQPDNHPAQKNSTTSLDSKGSLSSLQSNNCCESDESCPEWDLDDDGFDSEFDNEESQAEWNDLVDPIILRRLNTKEEKRQFIIHELIQTETQYVRTLLIMKNIYYDGMKKKLNISNDNLASIFPMLEEILDLNKSFLRDLKLEQKADNTNYCLTRVGNIILKHFDGENGQRFSEMYGYFCSRHHEAVALFKECCSDNKDLQLFNEKCLSNVNARRLSIPECLTYMSMRLTKYPLLIEAILKSTPEKSSDHGSLKESLVTVKKVLASVDRQIDAYEKEKVLHRIRKQIDHLSVIKITDKYGEPQLFEAYKTIPKTAKLLYDKNVKYRSGQKLCDVRMVIVTDKIIFFQKHPITRKLQLMDIDNRPPVLLLGEVKDPKENAAAARWFDENAVFIVTKSDIAEVLFDQKKDEVAFITILNEICEEIKLRPTEEEGGEESEEGKRSTDSRERKAKEEERLRQVKELIDQLRHQDKKIHAHLHFKDKIVQKLHALTLGESAKYENKVSKKTIPEKDISSTKAELGKLLSEVNEILTASPCRENTPWGSPIMQDKVTQAPRKAKHRNSVKKSATFGGFDNRQKRKKEKGEVYSAVFSGDAVKLTDLAPVKEPLLSKMSKKVINLFGSSRDFESDRDDSSSRVTPESSHKQLTNQKKVPRKSTKSRKFRTGLIDSAPDGSSSHVIPDPVRDGAQPASVEEPIFGNLSKNGKDSLQPSKYFASNEDLSSSSGSSGSSIADITLPSAANIQAYQHLSELLKSIIELTNQQDLEIAEMQEEVLTYKMQGYEMEKKVSSQSEIW